MNHPLRSLEWMEPEALTANGYNPNFVMDDELKLLRLSLLTLGWIQPILATPAGTIIDGFHRWMLSKDVEVRRVIGDLVPVARLNIGEAEAMAMTVRINRAKGTHAAIRMADLVKSLIDDHGWEVERVMREIGASREEVNRLHEDSIFTAKGLADYRYGKAWIPVETKGGAQ